MTSVELRRRHYETGEIETLARVYAPDPDGPAVIQADAARLPFVESVLADGVLGPDGRMLFLEDGESFVLALPGGLRGSRFWADLTDP